MLDGVEQRLVLADISITGVACAVRVSGCTIGGMWAPIFTASFILSSILLSGCSSTPAWERTLEPTPTVLDLTLSDFIPVGPVEMKITQSTTGASTTVSGYLDLGSKDDGSECQFELTSIQVSDRGEERFELRREAKSSFSRQIGKEGEVNSWYDHNDPAWVGTGVTFLPEFVTDGRPIVVGGGDALCTWLLLDRVARLELETGAVKIDRERAQTLLNISTELWVTGFLSSVGADQRDIDKYGPLLSKIAAPSFGELFSKVSLNVQREGDKVIYTQRVNGSNVKLDAEFTKTERRVIEKIEAKTYFEKLPDDPESKNWRADIEELLKASSGG